MNHEQAERARLGEQLERELGRELKHHTSLRDVVSSGIGGVADYYIEAMSIDHLVSIVSLAQSLALPWKLIGSGSQLVFSDIGYPGLVIRNLTQHFTFVPDQGRVIVEGGVHWPELVLAAAHYGLGGIESTLTLAGTIGGGIAKQRITVTGQAIRSLLRSVTILDERGEVHSLTGAQLTTHSFQSDVILVATFQLIHMRRDEIVRRIRRFELDRRRLRLGDTSWIGPIFASDYAEADPIYLASQFQRARVLGMRHGGAVFARTRPNYIEVVGRVTADDVQGLVGTLSHQLAETLQDPLTLQLEFIGAWRSSADSG